MPVERWFVYFIGLFDRLKDVSAAEALERLAVPLRIRERVQQTRTCRDVLYLFYRSNRSPEPHVRALHPP